MSKFTITVLQIVKNLANDNTLTIYQQIEKACPKIFNFNYPIWENGYKQALESKIISRYLNKEICYDNIAMWQFRVSERLNAIMPYYNQLYFTTINGYDYTKDYSIEESVNTSGTGKETTQGTDILHNVTTGTESGSSATNGTSNNSTTNNTNTNDTVKNTSIMSDVPQVALGVTDYASGITEDTGSTTAISNVTGSSQLIDSSTGATSSANNLVADIESEKDTIVDKVEQQTSNKIIKGNNKSIQELTMLQRETFINIDNMIVNELSDLFINYYEGR